MIAAFQALRAEKIGDLVGTARERHEGQLRLFVLRGIDDPERGAIPAFRIRRQLGVEPVERPVEGDRIWPAEVPN
ncbi:hypothetical protein K7459_29435, partial [Pseudomonas fluorescens]|nr:hypothetical protein [Pseudomonas fluorescens]